MNFYESDLAAIRIPDLEKQISYISQDLVTACACNDQQRWDELEVILDGRQKLLLWKRQRSADEKTT